VGRELQSPDPPTGCVPSGRLWTLVPATASAIAVTRRGLTDWLSELNWPHPRSEDIVLAVYEALANVVVHAYPRQPGAATVGEAELLAREVTEANRRCLRAVVTDYGCWRPGAVEQCCQGWGLAMMAACMDSVRIDPSPRGTTVIMTSVPVGIPAHRRPHTSPPSWFTSIIVNR
jgi:serine/threonine-protein kinase RsbW